MSDWMIPLRLEKQDDTRLIILRRTKTDGIKIVAEGQADWAGSLELRYEPEDEVAMRNTARVIHDLNADVLTVVEAESRERQWPRPVLKRVVLRNEDRIAESPPTYMPA